MSEDEDDEGGARAPAQDPITDYSYAFAIRRSSDDANLLESSEKGAFAPMGELYEVEVLIFRSFIKGTRKADPIFTSTFLVNK